MTGNGGQLACEIFKASATQTAHKFSFKDHVELDITNIKKLVNFFKLNKYHFIVNCAAYTNVEKAENETNVALSINSEGVKNLALISKQHKIGLIHISTDYVFDGKLNEPYNENSKTSPLNYYGYSKEMGEKHMIKINPSKSIIIRTSWLYSSFGNNFVNTILEISKKNKKIKVIDDQIGSPTYAGDLANTIIKIIPKIKNENVEIFHYSNEGSCSWYEFALSILKIKKIYSSVERAKTEDFNYNAIRPAYSILDKSKIKEKYNLIIPKWKKSLKYFLTKVL